MTAAVLVTRGARVDQIQRVLTGMKANVRVLAWGDDLRAAYDASTHVLIPGGADIDPSLYGEDCTWALPWAPDRDEDEAELVRWALSDGKPLMGICRGHQMIAAVAGGTLYQDLRVDADVGHQAQHHRIRVDTRSRLSRAIGGWCLVNSFHHQAVRFLPPGWRVVAESFDAVVEAIEHPTLPVISVQWHPESLGDLNSLRLFQQFLNLRGVT